MKTSEVVRLLKTLWNLNHGHLSTFDPAGLATLKTLRESAETAAVTGAASVALVTVSGAGAVREA